MRNLFGRLAALVLLAAVLLPVWPMADAAENSSSLTLKAPDAGEMVAFHVPNMFPGESVTREYVIETRHSEAIVLKYHADIRPDARYQKLAEVLDIKIEFPHRNTVLYDGLMAAMPAALDVPLDAGRNELTYRITVSLDTSVENDYMNRELVADFRWWFLDETDTAVTITAEKLMNGQYARGRKFTFVLKDAAGREVSRVRNDDGHIEFDSLYFTEPGVYTYTFQELKGSDSAIVYDKAVYTAVITVAQDGSHTISYERNGKDYGARLPRFLNATRDHPCPDDPSDEDPDNPKTGDPVPLQLLALICGSSLCALVCLFLLWKDRRKEARP